MSGKFGTSMFGFKRKKVIDYIETVNNKHNETINDLTQQLNSTQDALAKSTNENDMLRASLNSCESQLQDLIALSQELKAKVEANEQVRQKIGDIFVEAQHSAATIIENATENANSIVKSANECANNTIDGIDQTRNKLDAVREDLGQMLSAFDKALDSISLSLDKAKSSISPSGFSVNTDITEDDLIGNSIIKNS